MLVVYNLDILFMMVRGLENEIIFANKVKSIVTLVFYYTDFYLTCYLQLRINQSSFKDIRDQSQRIQ